MDDRCQACERPDTHERWEHLRTCPHWREEPDPADAFWEGVTVAATKAWCMMEDGCSAAEIAEYLAACAATKTRPHFDSEELKGARDE